MRSFLATTWQIGARHGWGVYGLNLILETIDRRYPIPISLGELSLENLPRSIIDQLNPIINFQRENLYQLARPGHIANLKDTIVLHSMGNQFYRGEISEAFSGERNVGVVFFEDTSLTNKTLARIADMDCIVAGSSWNADLLIDAGVPNVKTVFQGINTRLFRPLEKEGTYKEKFTIFSGGKLEFRKGQDIVIEAFKIFSERHHDVLLASAWHNPWPDTAMTIAVSKYTEQPPETDSKNALMISNWAVDCGITKEKFVDLGFIRNDEMPNYLKEMDLAIFPNRCEGGTNLVAMEAMGCGVPCIISANSGHLDLIDVENCFTLSSQKEVDFPGWGTAGWGESCIDELLEKMEEAYQNRGRARQIGLAGAEFIHNWNWKNQIGKLLNDLSEL